MKSYLSIGSQVSNKRNLFLLTVLLLIYAFTGLRQRGGNKIYDDMFRPVN